MNFQVRFFPLSKLSVDKNSPVKLVEENSVLDRKSIKVSCSGKLSVGKNSTVDECSIVNKD